MGNNEKLREYTHIGVPTDLIVAVVKVIDSHPQLGYRSRSEFIIEAIREKVKEIEKQDLEKKKMDVSP
jgi:metal-responsive CopG/Arc/MetJ family transcriptional regulator